jgi:PIN domain
MADPAPPDPEPETGHRPRASRLLGAVLDANVIYPAFLRDVLLRLAASDLYLPHWTERIHDEWIRNVLQDRPDLPLDRILRIRATMDTHFTAALVTGYEARESIFEDVDPKDRHVAAAALHVGAQRIITRNLRDFPAESLRPHGIVAQHPDDFVSALVRAEGATVGHVLESHRVGLQRPPHDPASYAEAFRRAGLLQSAALLWP